MANHSSRILATGIGSRKEAKALNFRFYKGRPCVNGHGHGMRFALCGKCVDCSRRTKPQRDARAEARSEVYSTLGRDDVAIDRQTAIKENLQFYIGDPCVNGHTSIRYASTRGCVDCGIESKRQRAENGRAEINAYQREYHRRHPDKAYAKTRRWKERNPEKAALNAKVHFHRRRARKSQLPGSHTRMELEVLRHKQAYRCAYCGTCEANSLDHKIPITREGSTDSVENLQWLCGSHNSQKRDRTDEEFRALYNIDPVTPWDAAFFDTMIEEVLSDV